MKSMKVLKCMMVLILILSDLKTSIQKELEFLGDFELENKTEDLIVENEIFSNITTAKNDEINLAGGKIVNLTYGEKTARVRMDTERTALHLNTKPINCFQFSTGNPRKDYPGNIINYQINEKNLKLALKEEKAIQILFKDGKTLYEEGELIEEDKTYYLIAVMWYGGEFHFVRMFSDGWFSKPSKVGKGDWALKEYRLPSEALGNLLSRVSGQSVQRVYKFLGFYLHPNRNDYINELLN
jgi:hypothetical protein